MDGRINKADYEFLRALLREHLGHDLGDGKDYLLVGRLGPVAEALELGDLGALVHRLRTTSDPALREAVLEAVATGETSFFRTAKTFERIRQVVIPALIEARAARRSLSIWCAGCSTGQEPYSIAMTFADHFPTLAAWRVELLATDSSESALRQARHGVYSHSETQRGLPGPMLQKHFHKTGSKWQIDARFRNAVQFRKLNLIHEIKKLNAQSFDIILVRNVLIYLENEYKTQILAQLREVIAPDGYLFLGESETILGLTSHFIIPPGDEPFYRPAPRA